MATSSVEGGCLCGAIRYRIEGSPSGSMICHCATCRRQAGAPVMAWLTFPSAAFRLLRGTPTGFSSSPAVLREFCGRCGTTLSYRHAEDPASLDVSTCSLDQPEAFPPTHHSWLNDDLHWLQFGDGLPQFTQVPPPAASRGPAS